MGRAAFLCILLGSLCAFSGAENVTTTGAGAAAPSTGAILGKIVANQVSTGNECNYNWTSPQTLALELKGPNSCFGVEFPTFLDCSKFDGLAWTVTNNGSAPANMALRLDTQANPTSFAGAAISQAVIPAGESRSFYFMFDPTNHPNGVAAWPPVENIATVFNPATVQSFQPSTLWRWLLWNNDGSNQNLTLSQIQLIHRPSSSVGMYDAYGQAGWKTWTSKAVSDTDLVLEAREEAAVRKAESARTLGLGSVKFTAQKSTTPSGAWSVAQSTKGNWFIKTPSGSAFWSLGANQVSIDASTQISGRSSLIANLPANAGYYSNFYHPFTNVSGQSIEAYNFYAQNLYKKFGPAYASSYVSETLDRFSKWGLNTLGRWSSASLLHQGTPYTVALDTNSYPTRLQVPNQMWNNLPDPYGTDFTHWCQANFTPALVSYKSDPNLMGVFVDNELSWGLTSSSTGPIQIAESSLDAPLTQPARQAFVAQLTAKYGSIAKLNAAWATKFSSWNTVKSATTSHTAPNAAYLADANTFVGNFAAAYFKQIRATLKTAAPNALYLGCRFTMPYTPTTVVAASAPNTDVISFNEYQQLDATLAALSVYNRPLLLSEFGYVSGERGAATTMAGIASTTEAERAAQIARTLADVGSNPLVVGAHMFSWVDDPACGRAFDGEAWTTGFVDVTDTPYPLVVSVFQNFAQNLASVRK